jgi:hypothetical protein
MSPSFAHLMRVFLCTPNREEAAHASSRCVELLVVELPVRRFLFIVVPRNQSDKKYKKKSLHNF